MAVLLDILSWICLLGGVIVSLIGGIGMLRLPDLFSRMHAAGMIDTLGVGLILVGLMFQGGASLVTVKLIVVLVFIFFTSPAATHALAKAALHGGVKPLLNEPGHGEPPQLTKQEGVAMPLASPQDSKDNEPSKT